MVIESDLTPKIKLRTRVRQAALSVLSPSLKRKIMYIYKYRKIPNFRSPKGYSELVNARILFDRSSKMIWTCDKLEQKKKLQQLELNAKISPTLWRGNDIGEIRHTELIGDWVFKPNFGGSGDSVVISTGEPSEELLDLLQTKTNLTLDLASLNDEWGYSQADHCYLVERKIGRGTNPPNDYKVFVFNGKAAMIGAYSERPKKRSSFFSPEWELLDVRRVDSDKSFDDATRPPHLNEMIADAELIARDFRHLRVDFYDDEDGLYFGETTPYPNSGWYRWDPPEFDEYLGKLWRGERVAPWPSRPILQREIMIC